MCLKYKKEDLLGVLIRFESDRKDTSYFHRLFNIKTVLTNNRRNERELKENNNVSYR